MSRCMMFFFGHYKNLKQLLFCEDYLNEIFEYLHDDR